jgi:polysaccharide export outer membrane protein
LSSEEVLVRIDGNISFPLLNDVPAAGHTTMQLKTNIEIRLKAFVENPVVTVTVARTESQKFYVLGEVANTGEYNLNKELTILQAFALAGGFTEWAKKDEIILFRKYGNKKKVIRLRYKEIIESGDFSKNITIKANDTIIVP